MPRLGQPVNRFDLIPGWGPASPWGPCRVAPQWTRASCTSAMAGSTSRADSFPTRASHRSIRIEAEGYLPAELIGFRDDAEDIAHDFKLRKAIPLSGIVRGPDGQPLAGAEGGVERSR